MTSVTASKLHPCFALGIAMFAWLAVGPLVLAPVLEAGGGLDALAFLKQRYFSLSGIAYHAPAACCAFLLYRRQSIAIWFGAVAATYLAITLASALASAGWDWPDSFNLGWLALMVIALVWVRRRSQGGRIV